MCFLILRAKLIIIETLPCYCPSFYKTSNTTIDMGGRLTLNFPFSTLAPLKTSGITTGGLTAILANLFIRVKEDQTE